MAPRYPTRAANPDRVTVDFDPITSAALAEAVKAAKTTRQRFVYEATQRALGISMNAPTGQGSQGPADHEDRMGEALRRLPQGPAGRP